VILLQLKLTKLKFKVLKSEVVPFSFSTCFVYFSFILVLSVLFFRSCAFSTKKKEINTDKLAINRQNIARVRLQLKFAFIIGSYESSKVFE